MEKELKALRMGFHPSKEGFKGRHVNAFFPIALSFHPSKEGFKGRHRALPPWSLPVSIPLRKVSRRHCIVAQHDARRVSIPLRKVSREPAAIAPTLISPCFHPSKEGFKAAAAWG